MGLINQNPEDAEGRRQRGFTEAEKEERRQKAVCGVLETVDRIILGHIDLTVIPNNDPMMAPGWTTGVRIYLNFARLDGKTDASMVALYGLNYHELAHVILTPRMTGNLNKWAREPHNKIAWNIMEDWRVETQFAALFFSAARYFRITAQKLIVNEKKSAQIGDHMMWPLLAGRFFLHPGLRERARRAFAEHYKDSSRFTEMTAHEQQAIVTAATTDKNVGVYLALANLKGEDRANKILELAEKYVVLSWSQTNRNRNRSGPLDLIEQFKHLLPWNDMKDESFGLPMTGSTGGTGPDIPVKGKPTTEFDEEAREATMEVIARDQKDRERLAALIKEKERDDSKPVVTVDPNQNVGKNEQKSGGDYSGSVSGSATDSAGWEGEGVWTAQLSAEDRQLIDLIFGDEDEVDGMLNSTIEADIQSLDTQRDLKQVRQATDRALGLGLHLDEDDEGVEKIAPPELINERNLLARELKLLRGQLDGVYIDNQPTGKIHLRSWINAPRMRRFSALRAWLPEQIDEADMEVVLLLDRSSSMSGIIDYASQVFWMLGSAAQEAEAKVTMIGFADRGKEEVLLGRNTVLSRSKYQSYSTYGGTNIHHALVKARKVLAASPLPNKLLLTVTDGGWSDLGMAVKEMRKINADNVTSVLFLCGMHLDREQRGHRHVVSANDIKKTSGEMKKIVTNVNAEAVRRVNLNRGVMSE